MPLPIPGSAEIAGRLAAGLEAAFRAGGVEVDARGENAPLGILGRVQAMGAFDVYLFLQSIAAELLPDTATDWLARHADIWGVPRIAATAAIGTVTLGGSAGLVVPAGVALSAGGVVVTTDAAATLGSDGLAGVAVTAATAGSAGSLAAGTRLAVVVPIAGLASATVAAGGLVGQDIEALETWRGRLLERVRSGAAFGQPGSYARTARGVAGVAYAAEIAGWVGDGSVGVVVLMAGPRVPTSAELAAVQAALDTARPVTARVVAVAGSLLSVPATVTVVPDTVATRAAVTLAWQAFFAAEAAIGGTLPLSRISDAISNAAGEYSHVLTLPAASVVPTRTQLPVPGAVSFA